MTPQTQALVKVGINFGAVVLAVWTAEASRNWYMKWREARTAKQQAGAPAAPPADQK